MNADTLMQAAAEELATVIGALLDAPGIVRQASAGGTPSLVVQLKLGGPSPATLSVGLEQTDAVQLARLVMGDDEEPAGSAVADTLQELCGQAMGALSQRDGFEGTRLGEATVLAAAPGGAPQVRTVAAGDRYTASVSFWASVDSVEGLVPGAVPVGPPAPPNLELILDIDLPLAVRFGETEMTLQSLTRLAPGSVIDLGRAPDDPVDVLVNGRLVARGEVVVVSGNYGVRIIEVVSPADRLKSVAA